MSMPATGTRRCAAAGYHAYRREHPSGYKAQEVACFLLTNTASPRSVGSDLAQLAWHPTQLRARYYLRTAAVLERLDHLNGLMTYQHVGDLSPFLDYVQREIGALQQDMVETLAG